MVTIVVLLILAAVAIGLSVGDNGIITSARNATDKWEQGAANEQDELKQIANFINSNGNNNGDDNQDEHITEVEGVTIPKGFYYVGGTKADGIVISDKPADENVYSEEKHADQANIPGDGLVGNQFVWVPVETPADFKKYPSYYNDEPKSMTNYHEPSQERYRYDGEETEYNLMKQSVEDNKGFYVARYEAGKEKINGVDTVVSKKGATVWNKIAWGDSMTSIGTEGAVAKAQGMYTNKEEYAVTSTLIYGAQWDAIMAWIDPAYKTTSCEADSFVRNSEGKGNYDESANTNIWKGDVATCGISDNYRVKNIYDLAGNVREWTMEAYSTFYRVRRGGGYGYTGSSYPASRRGYGTPAYDSDDSIGFRVALYL